MNAEAWCTHLVDRLIEQGVDTFYASPGSRSTPLILALARHPKTTVHLHVDERGQAYRAVGYARATGRPAGWVTTSGTAVANGLPAVVEAAQDAVPLLCMTADRPPELRGTGANQTIDQIQIFGKYPAIFFDWPVPETQGDCEPNRQVVDGVATATAGHVVHWNFPFREPFEADTYGMVRGPFTAPLEAPAAATPLEGEGAHWTRHIQRWIESGESGWLVVGELRREADREAVRSLAQALGWPVMADVLSGLAGERGTPYLSHGDVRLARHADDNTFFPRRVFHVGGRLVSKRWWDGMTEWGIDTIGLRDRDPELQGWTSQGVYVASIAQELDGLVSSLPDPAAGLKNEVVPLDPGTWLDERGGGGVEAQVAHFLTGAIPCDHGLWLSASLPIRLADLFHAPRPQGPLQVGANRGASGIDGVIHAAVGFAEGLQQPVTCLIGDLATLHDLNGLMLLRECSVPVIVVVLNNDGGGIFELLPVAKQHADVFTSCFSTPHGLALAPVATALGLAAESVSELESFASVWSRWQEQGQSGVIEVTSCREGTAATVRDWVAGE